MERGRRPARLIAIVAACGVFLLVPAFLVLGSLRQPGLPPPDGFEWLPDPVVWGNFSAAADRVPLSTYIRNSLLVVGVAVPVTVVVGSWAGFAIATARPRAQRVLVLVTVLALMIPASALWVPRFAVVKWLGLYDTLAAVGLPALMATSPFYVLLFALTYARLPRSLFEAAAVEGLSPLRTWWRVAFPLGWPAAAAVATLAFAFHWSNLIEPLLYVVDRDKATVAIGLQNLVATEPTNFPLLLAGSTLVTIPPVVAFLLTQRAFLVRSIG